MSARDQLKAELLALVRDTHEHALREDLVSAPDIFFRLLRPQRNTHPAAFLLQYLLAWPLARGDDVEAEQNLPFDSVQKELAFSKWNYHAGLRTLLRVGFIEKTTTHPRDTLYRVCLDALLDALASFLQDEGGEA
jgi:hypothetical protein